MRVLVLGNSHAATVRLGFAAIGSAFPDVRLSFWGLPGAAFTKARVRRDGQLAPDAGDLPSLRKVSLWNEAESIDLTLFDRIFLVGLRHGFRPALQLMRRLHPLDWGRKSGVTGVSEGFLRASVRGLIDASLAEQAARTPFDARFAAMPAPYPGTPVTEDGPLHEAVTAAIAAHPRAQDLLQLYEAEIRAAHAAHGLAFVPQPPDTVAAPFLSHARFLADPDRDGRHMNAEYGLAAFAALMAHKPPIKEIDHAMGS